MLAQCSFNNTSTVLKNIQYVDNSQQHPDWVTYAIREINVDTQDIVLHNIVENSQQTCKLIQVLNNDEIIDGLIQQESAYLGFNIGKVMHCLIPDDKSEHIKIFKLKKNQGIYKLISSGWDGSVGFLDTTCGHEINLPALTVIQNSFLLEQFESRDICHIGMTAGMSLINLLIDSPLNTEDNILRSFRYHIAPLR